VNSKILHHNKDLALSSICVSLHTVGIAALLILFSFTRSSIGRLFFIDKLILLAIGIMPFVFTAGIIICIYSLLKSANRKNAVIGIALNLVFLVGLVYLFAAPYMAELSVSL
jgi:hypothetical protein